MNYKVVASAAIASSVISLMTLSAQDTPADKPAVRNTGVRTLILNEDRDQKYMVSKVYELKHIDADDITPWIQGAVLRYNAASNCQRLNYKAGKKQWIVVTTGNEMMPYVDKMVETLDRPIKGERKGASIVDGSGIYRFTYRPKHRANDDMISVVLRDMRSDGSGWWDPANNLFYWKDSYSDGKGIFEWLEFIDRPAPQVMVTLNTYEVSENDFKELGLDWLAWKNGPGAELFGAGLDITKWKGLSTLASNSSFPDIVTQGALGSMGGFMVAPQFDASFIKMLAEKGKCRTASSGMLTFVNKYSEPDPLNANFDTGFAAATMKFGFQPQYQYINKEGDNRTLSVKSETDNNYIKFYFRQPTICFARLDDKILDDPAIIRFGYDMQIKSVMQNVNADGNNAVSNIQRFYSTCTLSVGTEKLLGTYIRESKVNQNIGIPFLCDIPVLKYFFGTTSESVSKTRVFVTVKASPVVPGTGVGEWGGKIIEAAKMN